MTRTFRPIVECLDIESRREGAKVMEEFQRTRICSCTLARESVQKSKSRTVGGKLARSQSDSRCLSTQKSFFSQDRIDYMDHEGRSLDEMSGTRVDQE